ncbi:peptidylprolyl isomerase [Leucobacter komagatae]|uniref:peptidylprolyl isomerase n=1 Tax=Leucobacter komagatae TaxID=55969 RepID=A0A542XXW3_9MICO|nr:FKBP-type peptidyl-prolyl cis-trans isomerase [Leucobacter komagatae]TQL40679.1 peptidylprolyl isomerase [Leucobacter komagatae]
MKLSRLLLPTAIVGALLLTGCTTGSTTTITKDATGESCAPAGAASKSIKVTGDVGGEIKLTSKTPIEIGDKTERTVLKEGKGEVFAEGQVATANYTIFSGKTGEVVNIAPDMKFPNDPAQFVDAEWAYDAVRCGAVGQRTAIVTSVGKALGDVDPAERGFTDLKKTDAFVFVFDFTEADEVAEPCEKLEPRDEKFPEVDLGDGKSEPTITIPKCMEPPAELEVKVLEEGDGPVVAGDEKIMTNYVGVKWNGGERFDGNWSETGIEFSTAEGALIQGFTQAMVGQKIGSTVLVTIPPELGYGGSAGHELQNDTLTFVLQLVSKVE